MCWNVLQVDLQPNISRITVNYFSGLDTNIVENTDWTTHHIADWTGKGGDIKQRGG